MFNKILFIKKVLCSERKIKREIKLNSEHFFLTCYTWNTTNIIWRIKYFFWYCLNTTERQFNNSNIIVNAIQRNLSICTKWASKLIPVIPVIAISLFLLQFSFPYNPAVYFNMGKKLWRHISLIIDKCIFLYIIYIFIYQVLRNRGARGGVCPPPNLPKFSDNVPFFSESLLNVPLLKILNLK